MGLGDRLAGEPLVRDLVEPVAQPLGEATGIGEDDGGAMLLDQVDDPLLDVGPDRRLVRLARLVGVGGGGAAELTQILDRDDHRQVEPLGGRRLDDLHLAPGREEPGHLVDRTDRRRQADPPCGTRQQLVETLQRHGEMGAALRARHCVHFVKDHRLDAGQRLPGGRGQHQEQ